MKKFLSFILVMAMVLSVSGVAMAEEVASDTDAKLSGEGTEGSPYIVSNETGLLAAIAETGIYIKLGASFSVTDCITIPSGRTVVLDLAGYTISQEKECTASYQMINNKGNLTITGNGKLSFKDTSAGDPSFGWGSYTIRNEGTLIVENGTIEHLGEQNPGGGQPNVHMYCAIFQYSGSTTINDGTISTPTYRSARLWSGKMTINGGNFEGQLWVQCVNDNADLTITGGTFAPRGNDGSSVFVSNASNKAALEITDGDFTAKIGCSDTSKLIGDKVTGGTFAVPPAEGMLADNFIVQAGTDGKVEVVAESAADPVAEVNGTLYTDIQKAIKEAAPSGTVKLLKDVVVPEWIMITESLSIGSGQLITIPEINGLTIDGDGHTLSVYSIESASNGNRLFYDATKLNIKNLTIWRADGVDGGIGLTSGTIENVTIKGGVYGIMPGNGDITITGCTFETNGTAIYAEEDRDNLVVTGNTFDTAEGAYAIHLRGKTAFTDNTVINGRVNATSTASGEISGNDFGEERFKVYNEATATISNNTINNLVFNDGTEPAATFTGNTMGPEAEAALDAVTPSCTITVVASPTDAGTVEGGTYKKGKLVTVTANAAEGYTFVAWMENGDKVSTDAAYTFTVTEDRKLVAVFEEVEEEPEAPVITHGMNGEFDGENDLTFRSNADFADFKCVKVDGNVVDKDNYTVSEGSTVVILKAAYLKTLSVGVHELAIVSETGEAKTNFTVKAAAEEEPPKPTKPDRKDIKVKYEGGNRFSTNKSAVPTSVEIDGVPVSFVGDGRSFTVSCIEPGTHWITVRWHSTSVTTNFTADASVVCIPNAIPKTGDMSVMAYALMAVIAAAGVMRKK